MPQFIRNLVSAATVATTVTVTVFPTAAAAQTDSVSAPAASPTATAIATALPAPETPVFTTIVRTSPLANLPRMIIGSMTAAGITQALGAPMGWSRTWGGYARRVGDQAGFIAIEETVRLSLGTTVDWVPNVQPCAGRASSAKWHHLLPRLGCAAREAVLLRTPEGRPRPNFPLVIGLASASAASATWRPDTRGASDGILFAVSRTAFALGGTVISHLISDWRADRP